MLSLLLLFWHADRLSRKAVLAYMDAHDRGAAFDEDDDGYDDDDDDDDGYFDDDDVDRLPTKAKELFAALERAVISAEAEPDART